MSKKYCNFASGWLKRTSNGGEYVSASVGDRSDIATLKATLKDGTEIDISSFAMFFNQNKKKDSHPDVNFTFTVE